MIRVLVDADACPVKEEIYRLAQRHDLKVLLVTHGPLHPPSRLLAQGRVETVRVARGLDSADDWIAANAGPRDIVVTADIPLAARCLEAEARALSPVGRLFTRDSIGDAVATRDLLDQLRQAGVPTAGPAPFRPADRTRFVSRLGELIHALKQESPSG